MKVAVPRYLRSCAPYLDKNGLVVSEKSVHYIFFLFGRCFARFGSIELEVTYFLFVLAIHVGGMIV